MRRYPAISELKKRDLSWIAALFVTAPLIALGVMVYQAAEVPRGAWIAIGALIGVDLLLAAVLTFPRSYLVVDTKRGIATFVDREGGREIAIRDLQPLFIRKVTRMIRNDGIGRDRPSSWYRVESAAAPVCFYRGATRKSAARRLARLNDRFGFSRKAPSRTEYLPSVRGEG